ncbi:mannitol dehydrogenase family protein [Acuticoccus sp. M5D2P5]|uniref:mannitol dehydrogenase family protein n=1 Tax=Acuticoccus kalidii TaxID=2910977 RepID=UPI001F2C67D7|nr:mannitol dehydrogenase family protein [Acuticoccus kalidii]MCF3933875.1 mannitol dehydrogenase family protein [Acuticoccus kalidii]
MMTRLSLANLPEIAGKAGVPTYERRDLSPGILHFGVGNFHRAHQATYLDRLFSAGRDHDFAIVGAGVMPGDAAMREALEGQDWLTTVVEQSADVSRAHVTGAMIDFAPVADAPAILRRLADPAIRIVSLTVTEGGYFIDSSGVFDSAHPAIVADGANPAAPKTVFGLIAAGLAARRAAGMAPFTVMSCDNIPHNGKVARNAVVGTAALSDPALADWIKGEVVFPNGMVDRITPATGERERGLAKSAFGIDDAWPVFCEDFTQWVLEDTFPTGRPALEEVGVEFVDDVSPYEAMKIRILNGGHAVIAYPAGLIGITYVHEAMAEPLIAAFLRKIHADEIIPVVPPVPNTDLATYAKEIERRFANPKIGDTVRRLCLDGSNRQPKFIVPSIADRLKTGASITGLALESALWCRYCAGISEEGKIIEPNDPNWDRLKPLAEEARENPDAWLGMGDIYGDVGTAPQMRAAFAKSLAMVWKDGTETTLRRYLDGTL